MPIPRIIDTATYSQSANIAPAVAIPARADSDRVIIFIAEDNSITPLYTPPPLDGKSWVKIMAGVTSGSQVSVQAWEVVNVPAGGATTFEWDWAFNTQILFHAVVLRDSAPDLPSVATAGRSGAVPTVTFDSLSPSWGADLPWLAAAWAGMDRSDINSVSSWPSNASATSQVKPVSSSGWSFGALATARVESASFSFADLTTTNPEEWATFALAIPGVVGLTRQAWA